MTKCLEINELIKIDYANGKSTTQIAKERNLSPSTIYLRIKKFGLIRSISEANSGIKNGMWKEKCGYSSLHEWVNNHLEKKDECDICKKEKN